MTQLRVYQQELYNLVLSTSQNTLAVSPAGSGKSVVMSHLVEYYSKQGKQVLFMVHRNNLLDQFNGHLSRYDNLKCDVLSPLRALKSDKEYDIIFIDETHHATSKSFLDVFDKYPNARRIGFTATPVRLDGERLAKPINKFRKTPFDVSFQTITIRELVSQGFLSDFDVKAVDYTLFFDNKQIKTLAGEYSSKSVSEAFRDDKIEETVSKFIELAKGRKTIAYTASIAMADMLTDELNRQGVSAKSFHSKLPAKTVDEYIRQFKNSEIEVCVNVDLFGEGFDVPDCDCVLMLRPTQSLSLYIQQFMRCMRRDPNNPDKRALIVDFANNTKTHGGLYTAEMRMQMKQDSELLKYCPVCETLNYAKTRVCDNPGCRHKFASGGGRLLNSTDKEEVRVGVEMAVVDYKASDELKSIAKLDERNIVDITTKFIHRLAVMQLASTDKKIKQRFDQMIKKPLYHGVKDVEPNMNVINLACEQFGFKQYDIEFFREAYIHHKKWVKELEAKQARQFDNLKPLAMYYQAKLKTATGTQRKEIESWLEKFDKKDTTILT